MKEMLRAGSTLHEGGSFRLPQYKAEGELNPRRLQRSAHIKEAEEPVLGVRTIRIVRIAEDHQGMAARGAYISASIGKEPLAYHPLAHVKKSADLQAAILKSADNEFAAMERRYRDLTDVCEDIRAARKKLAVRQTAVAQKRAT